MADTSKPPSDIEKELSVGNFAKQQARTIGFQIGGAAIGGGLGYAANRALGGARNLWVGGGVGLGMVMGGIASMYERWVKVERERISVQEINKDVAALMEKRAVFEERLEQQHDMVRGTLERIQTHEHLAQDGSHTEKELARREIAAAGQEHSPA